MGILALSRMPQGMAMTRREMVMLARLRAGLEPGVGCDCAVCGESPYDPAGAAPDVLGATFTDFDMLIPGQRSICVGCRSLLAGRPGETPPPLRMTHVVATESRIEYPSLDGLYARMREPAGGRVVISWATSKKRHHWLRAGFSTRERLLIGSDAGCIEYIIERDLELLDAVAGLLVSPTGTGPIFSRESIRSGVYHPAAVRKFGLAGWTKLEAVVSRWRPSLLLDLVAAVTPVSDSVSDEDGSQMIDPVDQRASLLLARLATASLVRRRDPKMFWGGFYRHRVERFRHLELPEMVSRLMDTVAAAPTEPSVLLVLHELGSWSTEEARAVAKAIESKTALILTMAYDGCSRKPDRLEGGLR